MCFTISLVSITHTDHQMEMLLTRWMKKKKTNWSTGLRFIKWQLNCSEHDDAYKIRFPEKCPHISMCDLKSTNLPPNTIAVDLKEVWF